MTEENNIEGLAEVIEEEEEMIFEEYPAVC